MNSYHVKSFVKEAFDSMGNDISFSENDDLILKFLKLAELNLSIDKIDSRDIFTFFLVKDNQKIDVDLAFIMYIGTKDDSGFLSFYIWDILTNKTNILPTLSSITSIQPNLQKIDIIKSLSSEILLFFKNEMSENVRVFLDENNLYFEKI